MDGRIVIGTELDTKSFENQIAKLEDELEGLVATEQILSEDSTWNTQSEEAIKLRSDIEKVNNRLVEMRKRQQDLDNIGFKGISEKMDSIGNSLQGTIRNVTKWGLALMGIRGAYSFISQSMSTLSSQDSVMATKIEYIRWAIANTIKPVIEWIINAIYKILGLFGGLIKSITGYNIFASATTKNFEKMKKSTGAIGKNTGKIKKDLYGWDEMTRVGESGGAFGGGSGGIGGDIQNASDKLPELNKEVEKFSKKIKNWFLGGYDTFGEALKNAPKDIFKNLKFALKDELYDKVLKPYLVDPMIKGYKEAFGPLYQYVKKNVFEPLKKEFKPVIDKFKQDMQPITSWIDENIIKPLKNKFGGFKKDVSGYKDEFIRQFAPFINKVIDMLNSAFGIFGVNIKHVDDSVTKTGNNIEEKIDKSVKDTIDSTKNLNNSFSNLPNKIKTTIEIVANTIKARNSIIDLLKDIGSAGIEGAVGIKGSIDNAIKKIKARKGAVINLPGRGVPVGSSVYGGESGREGVIPLTDSQQMELLGEAIGKYITINANITNSMNGRVISRELQKIQNESNFASNR